MVAELEQIPNAFSAAGFRHLLFTLSIFSALNFHLQSLQETGTNNFSAAILDPPSSAEDVLL